MTKDESKKMDDSVILRSLGIDDSMLETLEGQVLDSAKEKLKVRVGFTNNSDNEDPSHKYIDDSGMDVRANLESPVTINPSGKKWHNCIKHTRYCR